MRGFNTASRGSRLPVLIAAVVSFALAGAAFAIAAPGGNGHSPGGVNNGGHTPSAGNGFCDSGNPSGCKNLNPTDTTKPCTPVPGNGCHRLPSTPCERGHGRTEAHNKHCAPAVLTPTPTTPTTPPTTTTTPPTGTVSPTTTTKPGGKKPGVETTAPTGASESEEAPEVEEAEGVEEELPTAAPAEAVTTQASFTG
jgi:hypothetical protein